jgi:hypothetical protein
MLSDVDQKEGGINPLAVQDGRNKRNNQYSLF